MKKILMLMIVSIMLISFTSAAVETLGTFKRGETIELLQAGANFTFCNISSVRHPINNSVLLQNVQMTKDNNEYNYTLDTSLTNLIGRYIVNGYCSNSTNDIVWAYDFEVTGTGFEFNQPRALLTLALFGILIVVFIINVGVIPLLPKDDNKDEEGTLISINKLKYIRPVLYVTAWFLLIAIIYSASNLALAYLGSTLLGSILFRIFQVMFALSLPMIVIWFIFIFYNFFQDKKMKEYIDRGWQFDG